VVPKKRGETIMTEGEDAKKLYYIKRGSVK
jgi:CRP-like cAMP-binding protein